MHSKKIFIWVLALFFVTAIGRAVVADLTPMETLGKHLYFDTNLSKPNGQSCASCHAPEAGFADPDTNLPVSAGVLPNRFGNRNSPSAAYAAFSPEFHYDSAEMLYVGGQFWDGRASNLVEQAKGPFLNPLEMNNPNKLTVIIDVLRSSYADLFAELFGGGSASSMLAYPLSLAGQEQVFAKPAPSPPQPAPFNVDSAYDFIAEAIAAFERTDELNKFSSKYDYYLAGHDVLTEQELRGLSLFEDENKGKCALCHISQPGPDGSPPLLTDFTYDNLGVPKNPENPFYDLPHHFNPDGENFVDYGLGGILGLPEEMGKFKVMTLRNIAITPPYMHNGVFRTLHEVVDFYNTRDLGGWPPPEVPENVNQEELGNLGLTDQEVNDIVVFLHTLTDGYVPPQNLASPDLPASFTLEQSYPNPFNLETTISFSLSKRSYVDLSIYNILGEKVKTLVNGNLDAGNHTITWDGKNESGSVVASGIYFYKLNAGDNVTIKKMSLLK
jgi:cytochrome c peroxidase